MPLSKVTVFSEVDVASPMMKIKELCVTNEL
jgi:hypothetical protein